MLVGRRLPDRGDVNRYLRFGAFALGATVLTIVVIHSGPAMLWRTLRSSLWAVVPMVALWGVVYA